MAPDAASAGINEKMELQLQSTIQNTATHHAEGAYMAIPCK